METRKEIRELHRMACPILCHYVLTSLFEMFDQAIIGQNSTRGFALVGIASVVLYGVTEHWECCLLRFIFWLQKRRENRMNLDFGQSFL